MPVMAQNWSTASDVLPANGQVPYRGPGVLVVATSLQVLYVNQAARDLIKRIHQARDAESPKDPLPEELASLCHKLLEVLRGRCQSRNLELFQLTRVNGTLNSPLLLRGIGIADQNGLNRSRICIVMEQVTSPF